MQFDTLEIQKNVEEKRLILGQKFEKFLLKKLAIFFDFLDQIFAAKKTALLGAIFIIAVSILAQSSRDLGHDSATYPEIAQKILAGGKYFDDFFESNLPGNFVLTMIPVLFAKKFDFNIFATAQIFWNLLGILSLIWSAKILAKSELTVDRRIYNFVILAFAAGFFWRVFTLQFNEFGTKTTYLLAALFPYISYQLLNQKKLRNSEQIFCGILAAFFFSIKPHYGIFVVVFELQKLIKSKNILTIFCLRNYITLAVIAAYTLFIFRFFPDYIANISTFSAAYYDSANNMIFYMLLQDVFPFMLLIFFGRNLFFKEEILRQFLLVFIAATLLILMELIGGFDQRFILYSVSAPLVILLIFFAAKYHQINWRRDGFLILLTILLPQFDPSNTFTLFNYIICFWWVLAFYFLYKWQKIIAINTFLMLAIIALAVVMILIMIGGYFGDFSWLISALSLMFILCFHQNSYEKYFTKHEFSRASIFTIAVVASYLISLNLSAIFNFSFYYHSYKFKSPNDFNSTVIETIKFHTKKDESVLFLTVGIPGAYPAITYAGKKNELPFLQYEISFKQILSDKILGKNAADYIISRVKQQLLTKENKLFLIDAGGYADKKQCSISVLEYYLRDADFRKIFFENYVFLTRVTGVIEYPNEVRIIYRDAEIYLRK